MFKHLLNENAILKSVQDVDEYDVPTIKEVKTIKCKIEFAVKTTETNISAQKNQPARMYCIEKVEVGDIISYEKNNYKVFQVNVYDDFDGETSIREVFLI